MKLSPAQRAILERLAAGDRLVYSWSAKSKRFWLFSDEKGVSPRTFRALKTEQAIERIEHHKSGSTWIITDTGRAAIAQAEQTAGEEG